MEYVMCISWKMKTSVTLILKYRISRVYTRWLIKRVNGNLHFLVVKVANYS